MLNDEFSSDKELETNGGLPFYLLSQTKFSSNGRKLEQISIALGCERSNWCSKSKEACTEIMELNFTCSYTGIISHMKI
ncbi:MAG: hypothetical protein ACKVOU_11050 [Cytophagales bacterium]